MARDERNLKWDNLDQIKLDANVHLSTSARQQQTGRDGLAKIVLQIMFKKNIQRLFDFSIHAVDIEQNCLAHALERFLKLF